MDLQIFENEKFGKVRVIEKDGKPLFCLTDVGFALGYITVSKGTEYLHKSRIENIIKKLDLTTVVHDVQQFVTEDGLYELVFESGTEKAREFRKWVTGEVLPSIRKTGSYAIQPQCIEDLIIMQAQAMKDLRDNVQRLESTTQAIKDTVISKPDNWREDINRMFNRIVKEVGGKEFQRLRNESYKLLEQRAGANLNSRLDNLKIRLMNQGASKTAINNANRLDVIEADKKLREIYSAIIKEYTIKYVA